MVFNVRDMYRVKAMENQSSYIQNKALLEYLQSQFNGFMEYANKNMLVKKTFADEYESEDTSVKKKLEIAVAVLFIIRGNTDFSWWLERSMASGIRIPKANPKELNTLSRQMSYVASQLKKEILENKEDYGFQERLEKTLADTIAKAELDRKFSDLRTNTFGKISDAIEDSITKMKMNLLNALNGNDYKAFSIARENAILKVRVRDYIRIHQKRAFFLVAEYLGAYRFKWHTQQDDRVRATHEELEGRELDISSPLLQHLFDYGCRCYVEITGYYGV